MLSLDFAALTCREWVTTLYNYALMYLKGLVKTAHVDLLLTALSVSGALHPNNIE